MAARSGGDEPRKQATFAEQFPAGVALVALLMPGAGHLLLGRRRRALFFFAVVAFSAGVGCLLRGKLFVAAAGQPLSMLGTIASMGMGLPYAVLRWVVEYQGDILAGSYEYGGAFLLTAGLMNLLVVLDAWDIATGSKS